MSRVKLEVEVDYGEVEEAIKKLAKQLGPEQVEPVLFDAAGIITEESRRRAPVEDGTLRDAHVTRQMDRGSYGGPAPSIAAIDRKKAPHAHLVEDGTSKMPATPYFRPAVDTSKGKVAKAIESGLRRLVGQL